MAKRIAKANCTPVPARRQGSRAVRSPSLIGASKHSDALSSNDVTLASAPLRAVRGFDLPHVVPEHKVHSFRHLLTKMICALCVAALEDHFRCEEQIECDEGHLRGYDCGALILRACLRSHEKTSHRAATRRHPARIIHCGVFPISFLAAVSCWRAVDA
jgi:hypothetical protein